MVFVRKMCAVLAVIVSGMTPAHAEISGENAPEFKAALAAWLAGDDLVALQGFSALAKIDNRAAQIFLARINEAVHTHSHVTKDMPRKDRIALMRQPGGLSGKSWLKAASVDTPLAVAFLQVKSSDGLADGTVALLDLGEMNEAMGSFRTLFEFGDVAKFRALLKHPSLPESVVYWQKELMMKKAREIAHAIYVEGDQAIQNAENQMNTGRMPEYEIFWEGAVIEWDNTTGWHGKVPKDMVKNTNLSPLYEYCNLNCGAEIPTCMNGLLFFHLGRPFWSSLISPVESIVNQERYFGSPRIQNDLRQLIRNGSRAGLPNLEMSQCAVHAAFNEK